MERKNTITFILLLVILLLPLNVFAECMTCSETADGLSFCSPCVENPPSEPEKDEVISKQNPVYSPDVEKFIEERQIYHPSDFPDLNETVEALKAYLDGKEMAWKSKKKRLFDDLIDTGGLTIENWLEEGVKHLLSVKEKNPESRHVFEGLGRIYWELYFHTKNEEYLKKAADAFIYAEELGLKHSVENHPYRGVNYIDEVTDILSILGDRDRVDKYFSRLLKPTPDYTYLNYAKVLSKLNDERADEFFKKVLSIRKEGDINPIVDYAEYLLDRKKDKEALSILKQLKPSEEYFYTHFLKGVALERIGRLKEAEKEYKKYLKFREPPAVDTGVYRAPSRYKIPGSKLQKDIPFDENSDIHIMDKRSTPCGSTDWECMARYYMVYTINGEAERGGGTLGMMRAVAWNVRTRVFYYRGVIACPGTTGYCHNYAAQYSLVKDDINSVYRRYYYVIETGGYAGLSIGSYTTGSKKVYDDVFNGRVPDPIVGACLYGSRSGTTCDGTCSDSGIWNSFTSYKSGVEFRAGRLEYYWDALSGTQCYRFIPTSTPTGGFCGKDCWASKGVICPVTTTLVNACHSPGSGYYNYTGPCYGNFFWRFNQ